MSAFDIDPSERPGGLTPALAAVRAFAWGEVFILIPMHAFWMLFRCTPFVAENTASAKVAAVPLVVLAAAGLAALIPRLRAAILGAERLFHLTAAIGMLALLLYITVRDPLSPRIPITWPLCFWSVCIAFAMLANLGVHERMRAMAGPNPRLPWVLGALTAVGAWAVLVWVASGMAWPAYFWTASLVFHALAAMTLRRSEPTPAVAGRPLRSTAALVEHLFIAAVMLAAFLRLLFTCTKVGRLELKYPEFVSMAASPEFLTGAVLALLAARFRFAFVAHAAVAAIFLLTGETASWPIGLVLGYGFVALFIASTRQGSLAYALGLPATGLMWALGMLGFMVAGTIIELNMGLGFANFLVAKMRVVVPVLYVAWLILAGAGLWRAKARGASEEGPGALAKALCGPAAVYGVAWVAILVPVLYFVATTMWPPVSLERPARVEVGEPAGVCHAGYSRSDEEYANLDAMGVRMMRIDFHWHRIQKDAETWDFSNFDSYVDAAQKHGVKVLALLVFDNNAVERNEKGAKRDHYLAPEDLPLYLEYIRRTVTRYKGRVYAWELWNEPDIPRFWDGPIDELYELVRQAAKTVRETDPDAILLGPAMTSPLGVDAAEGIEDLHAIGALEPVDHPTMHSYISDPRAYYNEYFRVLNAAGKYGHPGSVWITELGPPDGGVYPWRGSRDHVAVHVMKAYTIATCVGIETLVWYCYHDSAPESLRKNPLNSEGFFGLTNQDDTWKPAAQAFSLFSKNCSNSTIRADLVNVTGGLAARQLRTALYRRANGQSALVLWFEPGLRPGAHARVAIDLGALDAPAVMHGIASGDRKPLLDGVIDVFETPTFITFTAPDGETPVALHATTSPADATWLLVAAGLVAIAACAGWVIKRG
ncbi:MAG: cellulase family glycosylhydrolase [Candidatus Hydrogenedentes bacterium]|nr:cellulase family glycosylhydrolase [Candidatus Hydrogenedentota bacterium]